MIWVEDLIIYAYHHIHAEGSASRMLKALISLC